MSRQGDFVAEMMEDPEGFTQRTLEGLVEEAGRRCPEARTAGLFLVRAGIETLRFAGVDVNGLQTALAKAGMASKADLQAQRNARDKGLN